MNSGPVVAMAWEGQGAVKTGRFGQSLKSDPELVCQGDAGRD